MTVYLKNDGFYCSVRDENDAVLAYDAARKIAVSEVRRDLEETEQLISYVRYFNDGRRS